MTPVQRHAELVYAECLAQKAILGIVYSGVSAHAHNLQSYSRKTRILITDLRTGFNSSKKPLICAPVLAYSGACMPI
jgi:hypothetical protein